MTARPETGLYRSSRPSLPGGRPAALLQLLALLLILASPLLPAIARTLATPPGGGECRGDHRLCGCPPARIASNTCCCAMAVQPSCCVVSGQQRGEHAPIPAEDRRVRAISALPCGGEEPVNLAAGDPWLPASSGPDVAAAIGFADHSKFVPAAKPSPSLQPDVPPPRPAFPS